MATIKHMGRGNRCLPYRDGEGQRVCNLVPGSNDVPAEVALAVVAAHPDLFEGPGAQLIAEIPRQDAAPVSMPEEVEPAPEVSADEALSVDDLPPEWPKSRKRGGSKVKP